MNNPWRWRFYREAAGVISKNKVWIIICPKGYLYSGESLFKLFREFILEFRQDKHLVG